MFGFTKKIAEEIGSAGRFLARIEKFRNRNNLAKHICKTNIGLREYILKCRAEGKETSSNVPGWDDNFLVNKKNFKKLIFLFHPVIEHHFWWLTHNWLAHFMIGLIPIKPFFDFHDWTSKKLNAH